MNYKTKNIILFTITSILSLSLLSSCGKNSGNTSANSQDRENTFIFNLTAEPPTIDWNKANDNVSIDVLINIMEGLMHFDKDLKPVPDLAESYTLSKDGLTYTFILKKGIKWTDGKELTADDFRYSWLRALNPMTASTYAYFLFDIKNARDYNAGKIKNPDEVGIKVLDPYTLQVTLSHPASYWLNIPTFTATFPARKDLIEKYGDQWTNPKNLVTLGPYKVQSWEHTNKLTMIANPTYHGPQPYFKKVIGLILQEESTAISLFESGDLDFVRRIPALDIPRFKGKPEYHVLPALRIYYYGFNIAKKPFTDKRVRYAFSQAIDRSKFPELLMGGQIAMTSIIPKGMPGYEPNVGLHYDPDKARQLLADAGYPNGKNFPKVTAYFDSGRQDHKTVAEALQQMWKKELNVNVDLQQEEWKVHLKLLETDAPQLWRLGWGADYPDPDNFLQLFTSYSGNNHTHWKNPQFDKLIEEGAAEQDMDKRLVLYRQAQKILTEEDVPVIPLFSESHNYLLKPSIKGFQPDGMSYIFIKNAKCE